MKGATHPVLHDMLTLGRDQKSVLMAFQTYLELCEEFALKNVQYAYNEDTDLIYLTAAQEDSDSEVYVPVHVRDTLNAQWLNRLKQILGVESFNLVIRESDSSKVIFKITNDLVPPASPEATRVKLLKTEKIRMLDREIPKFLQKEYALLKKK